MKTDHEMPHSLSLEERKNISERMKGNKYFLGRHHSQETIEKIIKTQKGKYNKGAFQKGEKHPGWKGGISKDKKYWLLVKKEHRHKTGFSKKYISECSVSKTREYKKLQRQKRKALMRGGGRLSIKTIQLVYEDNIKKYGTLTCYLCIKPIKFGKDNLEHRIPLIRGGTNHYDNLAIACQCCNYKKHHKTEEEYRNHIQVPVEIQTCQ